MAIKHIRENIFNTKCQTIVNTMNCVGVIGKGIAFVHKLRYPQMYKECKEHCKKTDKNWFTLALRKTRKRTLDFEFPNKISLEISK